MIRATASGGSRRLRREAAATKVPFPQWENRGLACSYGMDVDLCALRSAGIRASETSPNQTPYALRKQTNKPAPGREAIQIPGRLLDFRARAPACRGAELPQDGRCSPVSRVPWPL